MSSFIIGMITIVLSFFLAFVIGLALKKASEKRNRWQINLYTFLISLLVMETLAAFTFVILFLPWPLSDSIRGIVLALGGLFVGLTILFIPLKIAIWNNPKEEWK